METIFVKVVMPQVDISSFSNQIYYFAFLVIFMLYFITKKLLLCHYVVLRMRNLNPIKLLFWRKCLWYYIRSFRDKTSARYYYLYYHYFQEGLKLQYYIHMLYKSKFTQRLTSEYRKNTLESQLSLILQSTDIAKLANEVLNDLDSQ